MVQALCHGLNNQEIAQRLEIRPGTVKTHTRNIYRSLRVRDRVNMLLACLRIALEKLLIESRSGTQGPRTLAQLVSSQEGPGNEEE